MGHKVRSLEVETVRSEAVGSEGSEVEAVRSRQWGRSGGVEAVRSESKRQCARGSKVTSSDVSGRGQKKREKKEDKKKDKRKKGEEFFVSYPEGN